VRSHAKASSAGSNRRWARGRGRPALLALACAILATSLLATAAFASKETIDYLGTLSGANGAKGGEFSNPGNIAVNETGAGPAAAGDFYVVDRFNHRVQRFDSGGAFISAWGADVSLPDGGTNYEICTVASECQQGAATAGNGAFDDPAAVAVDGDTGNVYVSDRGNRRVNVYDGGGAFIVSFGFDVQVGGITSYEICGDLAGDVCKAGVGGAGVGQVGSVAGFSSSSSLGIAVSQPDGEAASGTVFLADTENRRVNTYGLDGTSPSSFGSAANFAATQPALVAVDSRGIVYASDAEDGAEVDRYDSQNANGVGVGFLESIAAEIDEEQTVTFTGFKSGDQFELTCPDGSIAHIAYPDALSTIDETVEDALKNSCGVGGFFVARTASSAVMVVFRGNFTTTDVPQMACTPKTGSGSCSVGTVRNGSDAGVLLPGYRIFGFGDVTAEAFGTHGLAVDPDSDGPGPDEDVLHVLRKPFSGNTVVQQLGPLNDPGLTAAAGGIDDTHGNLTGFNFVTALGVSESADRLFVSSGARVFVLDDPPPFPGATIAPVSAITDTTATFSGVVDPKGGRVTCRFQYATDPDFTAPVVDVGEAECPALASGGGPQAVSQDVTGLDPNTTYFARLVVTRQFDTSSSSTSSIRSFKTDAVPPVISDVGAVHVTDTSARLVATIDPRHNPTGYVFEYGATPALGSSTAPLGIGDGTDPIVVSQVIGGLSKDTTYYFRVIATNLIGTTTSPGNAFHTRTIQLPNPAERAYEQVSPPDKNYGDVDLIVAGDRPKVVAAANGEGVAFCTTSLFGEPAGRMASYCSPYVVKRTAAGWHPLNDRFPDFCRIDSVSGDDSGAISVLPSPDYSRLLFVKSEYEGCPIPPLDPAAPLLPDGPSFNWYLQSPLGQPIAYDLLNTESEEGAETKKRFGPEPGGGSDDFSHVVYHSVQNQTPDSPPPGDFYKVYEWDDEEGVLRLVSKGLGGEALAGPSGIPTIGDLFGVSIDLESAVSDDGERIYFDYPTDEFRRCLPANCELYMREGGTTTFDVSASECTGECGTPHDKADYFLSATQAGDKAFFTSCAKLTDASAPQGCPGAGGWNPDLGGGEAGSKLYRWDRGAPPGGQLVDLSVDREPSDGSQPGFFGLIGHSEDGDTAYFATRDQIVAGEPTFPATIPSAGGVVDGKMYRWRWNGGSPEVEFIGPYPGLSLTSGIDHNISQQRRQVSADGRYVTIYTAVRVDPAADHDSDVDIYRWGEKEGWQCASCQLPGVPSGGDIDLSELTLKFPTDGFHAPVTGNEPGIQMSADGQRVFFGTPDALVPQDVNGELACPLDVRLTEKARADLYTCNDVYEWHDGTVSLISSGTDSEAARLVGASASGRDAFFLTRERLVGWDRDNNVDVYDARIGGGFLEPSAQPPTCESDGCRGAGSIAPPATGAGSAAFQGPGDPKAESPRGCPKGKRQVRRKGRTRCVAKQGKRRGKHAQRRPSAHRTDTDRRAAR
jgi:hypothetical protein